MRFRFWALVVVGLLLVAVAGCAGGRSNVAPTPAPTKTLRPIFTSTPVAPTAVPPTATPQNPPTATPPPSPVLPPPEPPTAVPPTATPQPATFTVTSATVNIRSGPGTNYSRIAQVRQGQTFEITGKNPAGDWWQFDYSGKKAWVIGRLVTATATGSVQVAADIPAPPPTARPQPTAKPAPPKPTQTPAPTTKYRVGGLTERVNTNERITVYCQLNPNLTTGIGDTGAIRVTRGGGNVAPDHQFGSILNWANTGMTPENQFLYNENCKVELPLAAGTYSAYIVQNGQQASDPISFEVRGDIREFVLKWVLR